jgi:hypothetical protein
MLVLSRNQRHNKISVHFQDLDGEKFGVYPMENERSSVWEQLCNHRSQITTKYVAFMADAI